MVNVAVSVKQWELGDPFVKFNQIAGFHLIEDGVGCALHFDSIVKRLSARWDENAAELAALGAWWEAPDTQHDGGNQRLYMEVGALLQAERRQLEALWIEIRPYVMGKEQPTWEINRWT